MRRTCLVEKRMQLGLTQQNVADKSEIKRAFYTQIELGTRDPSVYTAKKIAKVLKIKWTIFFENKCNVKNK